MQTKIFLVLPELLEGIDIKYMEEGINNAKDKDFVSCNDGNNKNISGLEILQELESLYPYQTGTGYTNEQYECGRSSLMNKYNDFTHNITSTKGLSTTPNNSKAIKYKEENVKIVYPTYTGMSIIQTPEKYCMNCGGVVDICSSYVRGCVCSITYKRTLISDSMIRISDFKINDLKEILKDNIGRFDSIIIDYDFFISDLLKRECIFFYVVVPSHSLLKSMETKETETNKDLSKYKYRNAMRNGLKNGKMVYEFDSKLKKLTKITNDINCEKQYGFMRLVTEISDIVLFLNNFKKQIEFDESIKEHVSDINNRNYNFNKYVFGMVDNSIDVINKKIN